MEAFKEKQSAEDSQLFLGTSPLLVKKQAPLEDNKAKLTLAQKLFDEPQFGNQLQPGQAVLNPLIPTALFIDGFSLARLAPGHEANASQLIKRQGLTLFVRLQFAYFNF